MKIYYDIHIHSVLSSCADVMQTPNNILNMCMLKELNMISITDHNSSLQYEAIDKIKDSYDFLVLYGIELTIKEGCHIVVYFKYLNDLNEFNKVVQNSLDKNIYLDFGEQVICDEYDEIKYMIDYKLNQKLCFDVFSIINLARRYDTIIIPAHINRGSQGILYHYSDLSCFDFDGLEIYDKSKVESLEEKFPSIKKYKYLFNSDAHSIEVINEKDNYIELDELTFDSFKRWLHE